MKKKIFIIFTVLIFISCISSFLFLGQIKTEEKTTQTYMTKEDLLLGVEKGEVNKVIIDFDFTNFPSISKKFADEDGPNKYAFFVTNVGKNYNKNIISNAICQYVEGHLSRKDSDCVEVYVLNLQKETPESAFFTRKVLKIEFSIVEIFD